MLIWLWQRRWSYWVALPTTVIATLILMWGVSFIFHLSGHICPSNGGQDNSYCYRANLAFVVIWEIYKALDAIGVITTAIATALLAWITWLLVHLGREQSETARAELRAYISVIPVGMSLSEDNRTVRIYLEQTNVGRTPALDTKVLWNAVVRAETVDAPLTFTEEPMSAGPVIYPRGNHTPSRAFKLTDKEFTDLTNVASGQALFVFGRAKYVDVFKRDQTAEFCGFLAARRFREWYNVANTKPNTRLIAGFQFAEFNNTTT